MEYISRIKAEELLKKYNKDPFHLQHAYTVEAVMKWYANELGYTDEPKKESFMDKFMGFINSIMNVFRKILKIFSR